MNPEAFEILAKALERDAAQQKSGKYSEIGMKWDEVYGEILPIEDDFENPLYSLAFNFWDAWADAANHEWQYHEPITKKDWPIFAKKIASSLRSGRPPTNKLIIESFYPKPTANRLAKIQHIGLLRRIVRWGILIILIILGLIYLNSSVFSIWAANGPPCEIPKTYMNRALIHFCYSVSSTFTGIIIFVALKAGLKINKSILFKVWLITIITLIAYPQVREFYLVDSCHDSGGSWNKKYFECNH